MSAVDRILNPLRRGLRLMVSRAVVTLVDDGVRLQGLQVRLLADELRGDVERFQQYGFTSVPHAGAEAIALSVGASRDHAVVISVDDRRYRLVGLEAGEAAMYTDEGDRIVLRRGGVVEIHAAAELQVHAPLASFSGNLVVDGNIDSGATITAAAHVRDQGGAKSMAGMRTAYNAHTHPGGSVPSPGM